MRSHLFSTSCYSVMAAAALAAQPATAQDAGASAEGTTALGADDGGAIVVTARRREETLQEIPVSISVLSDETIAERGIANVSQVADLTPGLQFDKGASPADVRPSLRGIALVEGRSNVAMIVDGIDVTGVSLNTTIGGGGAQTATSLLDLERVEVVKGPQTVYFGRSAFAGAIQFISRDPEYVLGGKVNAAIGDYGQREITGHITGPISENVAFKVSGTYNHFGGFYENPGNGQDLDGSETYGVGGTLLVENGGLTAKIRANYIEQDAGPGAGFILPREDTSLYGVNRITEDDFDESQVAISSDHEYAGNDSETFRGTLDLEYELGGGFVVNSLTGINKVTSQIEFDFDKKPANVPSGTNLGGGMVNCLPDTCVGIFDFDTDLQQISSELRLSFDDRGPLRVLVGGYFFDENYEELDYTRFLGARPFITSTRENIPVRPARLETNTYSAFGSIEYDLTEKLTATAELRFNHEVIRAESATGVNILFLTGSNEIDFQGRTTFDSWLPRFSVNYAASPDLNLYATVAKGSKPGGFNTGQLRDDLRPFGQETIWTYEVGAKGTVFDILTLEAAAYYSEWTDVQTTTICYGSASPFGPEAECPSSGAVTINYIINADSAEVKGLELTANLNPAYWLNLSAAYAYTDSKFEDFVARDVFPAPAGTTRQFGGNRVQLIPRHSLTGNARVDVPVSTDWDGFGSVTGTYRSERYARFDNRVLLDDKAVFDLQVGMRNDSLTALVFVNNVFDDRTPDFSRYYGDFNPSNPNGEYITAPAKRTFGVRLIKEF